MLGRPCEASHFYRGSLQTTAKSVRWQSSIDGACNQKQMFGDKTAKDNRALAVISELQRNQRFFTVNVLRLLKQRNSVWWSNSKKY